MAVSYSHARTATPGNPAVSYKFLKPSLLRYSSCIDVASPGLSPSLHPKAVLRGSITSFQKSILAVTNFKKGLNVYRD